MSEVRRYPMPATVYWDGTIERDATLTPKRGDPAHPRVDMVLAADHDRIAIEQAQRIEDERRRRTYYQGIVYSICAVLDRIFGRSARSGTGIVCGTVDKPSTEVEEKMQEVAEQAQRIEELEKETMEYAAMAGEDANRIRKLEAALRKISIGYGTDEMRICAINALAENAVLDATNRIQVDTSDAEAITHETTNPPSDNAQPGQVEDSDE